MSSLLEVFCDVDDFCLGFLPAWQAQLLARGARRRHRARRLALSEVMTLLIMFHRSHYRDFKTFSLTQVWGHWRAEFPGLVSYSRFVEYLPATLEPLWAYLLSRRGQPTGISFIDSTPLAVCKPSRIRRHRVFQGLAARGKTSGGWFFGFKLHLIVNDHGELLACTLTPGNVDERPPVPKLARHLWGKLFGDKGYISHKLFAQLFAHGLQLITPIRKNMRNILLPLTDKILLRKRSLIETINDQLKNISQIEHSRHRSPTNFLVNLLAGLIAYTHQPKKPSLNLHFPQPCLLV